mmetsp:Transcript_30508/g.91105  ORF Transcript_30508/g.91105 Transcript_30508/m.91105 type:complete len:103 (+) Transcript_30508:1398-1706(+)
MNLYIGISCSRYHLERPMLHVALDTRISEFTTDQTLRIEDSARGIDRCMELCGLADDPMTVSCTEFTAGFIRLNKSDYGWSSSVTFFIRYYLYTAILPDANA